MFQMLFANPNKQRMEKLALFVWGVKNVLLKGFYRNWNQTSKANHGKQTDRQTIAATIYICMLCTPSNVPAGSSNKLCILDGQWAILCDIVTDCKYQQPYLRELPELTDIQSVCLSVCQLSSKTTWHRVNIVCDLWYQSPHKTHLSFEKLLKFGGKNLDIF